MNLFEARAMLRGVVIAARGLKGVAVDYVETVPQVASASGTVLMSELLAKQIGATMGADVTGDPSFTGAKQAAEKDDSKKRLRDDAVEAMTRDMLHKLVAGGRGKALRRAVRRVR